MLVISLFDRMWRVGITSNVESGCHQLCGEWVSPVMWRVGVTGNMESGCHQ